MTDQFIDDRGDPGGPGGAGTTLPAAVCYDVHKVYRTLDEEVEALAGVHKDFPPGRITTIAGPSGSGKSSLLRILACVDRPDRGYVRIGDIDVSELGARGRRALRRTAVGYVFQNPMDNLVEYLHAVDQLKLAARLRGVRPGAGSGDVDRLLEVLGLEHRRSHRPVHMSGGEQQRLAVACAVIGRPSIVVADEPTAELDSGSADRVLDAIGSLRDEGVAFILSSRDARVVEATDHLLRLERGRTVESW